MLRNVVGAVAAVIVVLSGAGVAALSVWSRSTSVASTSADARGFGAGAGARIQAVPVSESPAPDSPAMVSAAPGSAMTGSTATVSAAAGPPVPGLTPVGSVGAVIRQDVLGLWQFADVAGPVVGTGGPTWQYRVAVEEGVAVTAPELTDVVDTTLGDGRSWVGGGEVQLRRVGADSPYDFTVRLASPATAYAICVAGGVDIRIGGVAYTSCRVGENVVINASRYLGSVPGYGAPLSAYRQYVVNHEVGHWLGHGHVGCPGPGQPAPVMAQQTLGLQGCVPNSWPYLDGHHYTGPPASG